METRETTLKEAVSELSKFDSEMTALKMRVEESAPEVVTEFYNRWRFLHNRQKSLENQIRALGEAGEDLWADLPEVIDCNLQELRRLMEGLGAWIWPKLSDNVWKFR